MIEPEAEAIERIQNNGNHPVEWLEFLTQCQAHTPGVGDERYRHLVYLYGRAVNLNSAEENRKIFHMPSCWSILPSSKCES